MEQGVDKRISPRLDVCVAAKINVDEAGTNSIVRNLSDSGIYIITDREYKRGTITECELELGNQKISFKGEIVRSLIGDEHYGYGVQIVEINQDFRQNLDKFLKESWVLFHNAENSIPADQMILENSQYEIIHNVDVMTAQTIDDAERKYSEFDGLKTRIARANFPYEATLDNFNFLTQPAETKNEIDEMLKMNWIKEKKNAFVFGPTGAGKTHIAIGIASKAIESGFRANFINLDELIKCIKNATASTENRFKLAKIMDSNLIVLDELGTKKLSKNDSLIFENFVNKVSGNISVMFTSNITLEQFNDIINNEKLVKKIVDSIEHIVFLKGIVH